MSNVTQAPAPEIAISPKLVTKAKAFVTWEVGVQQSKGEKLNEIINLIREDLKRGVTKKMITFSLKEAGMDAGAVSNSIAIASPVSTEAQAALATAEKHNATLPKDARTGSKLGFHDLVKIAKGEETPETVLAKRAEKKAPKSAPATGKPAGTDINAASAPLPKLTKAEFHKRIYALIKLADDDGFTMEDIADSFTAEVADYVQAKANPVKA